MKKSIEALTFLLALASNFSFAKQNSKEAVFALFVETPSVLVDSSHAAYARDQIASELAGLNFRIVTPESVTQAVESLRDGSGNTNMKVLEDNNMQTLALQLEADYFIHFTLNEFRSESKDLPRFDRKIFQHRLKANFRVASSHSNASVFGKSLSAEKKIPVTSNVIIETSKSGMINQLIDQLVKELVHYVSEMESGRPSSAQTANSYPRDSSGLSQLESIDVDKVGVTISTRLKGLAWPEIRKDESGQLIYSGMEQTVEATDAEIEIDGIFVGNGSSVSTLSIAPGIRRLKVSRAGYVVVDKMINAHEGLELSLTLEPSEEEYTKWREQLSFLQSIKIGEKLTEAEVRKAEGLYEYLKNSKFEVPSSVTYKSLY